jgi:hypothetical protein
MTSPTRSDSSGSPARPRQAKRVTLTATQKQAICQYHAKNPKEGDDVMRLSGTSIDADVQREGEDDATS